MYTKAAPLPRATPVAPITIVLASAEIAVEPPKKLLAAVIEFGESSTAFGLVLLAQPVAGCCHTQASPMNGVVVPPNPVAPATIVLPLPDSATDRPSWSPVLPPPWVSVAAGLIWLAQVMPERWYTSTAPTLPLIAELARPKTPTAIVLPSAEIETDWPSVSKLTAGNGRCRSASPRSQP